MTIYLIRHGKTEANEKHLYCGSTDLPLSEAGKAELQVLHYDIKIVAYKRMQALFFSSLNYWSVKKLPIRSFAIGSVCYKAVI